jgi:RHS repeat-associated protein
MTASATVSYGPDRRYVQTVMPHPSGGNTETIRYIGEALQRRTRGTVTDWRHVVYVGAEAVAIISRQSTGTNTVRYRLSDHQGSTAVLASNSGAVLLKESFGAYGGARNGSTWSGGMSTADQATMVEISRQGYTGHTMLGFGGLIHMNGRVQDSVTGRFLSPDPYVTEPGHTQGYNRYAYVRNNPTSFVDPSGFSIWDNLRDWLCDSFKGNCVSSAPPPDYESWACYQGTECPEVPNPPWNPPGTSDSRGHDYNDPQRDYADYQRRQEESRHQNNEPTSSTPEYGGASTGKQEQGPARNPAPLTNCPNGGLPSRAANEDIRQNVGLWTSGGAMTGTLFGLWAVSHLVGVGEVADVAVVSWRVYKAVEAAQLAGRVLVAVEANGGAYMAGAVGGAAAGGISGEVIGIVATPPICPP